MPKLKKHIEFSIKRTGKSYRELHEWLDGKNINWKIRTRRHLLVNLPKFLPFIKKKFGNEGVEEYVRHLDYDYKSRGHILLWIYNKLRRS